MDEFRKFFTIKRPDLGGIQITDTEGPTINVKNLEIKNDILNIDLDADAETIKVEIYVDDELYLMVPWTKDLASIVVDVSGLTGTHTVKIIAHDRFLNKTRKELEIVLTKSKEIFICYA